MQDWRSRIVDAFGAGRARPLAQVALALLIALGCAVLHAVVAGEDGERLALLGSILPGYLMSFAAVAVPIVMLAHRSHAAEPALVRSKPPKATEKIVTIMFIDIVGFSRMAEQQTPEKAFEVLKRLLDSLRKDVRRHGGYVDRTLGDGMLCVFGYDPELGETIPTHADDALACAAEIQRANVERILKARGSNQTVFPLRIGINTAAVFIGNLGDREVRDVTVIGSGVNLANRLEAACDRHMVLLGATTRDLLRNKEDLEGSLRQRFVSIKHHSELVEAYEFDPFHGQEELLQQGDEAYREAMGVERNETRWPVPAEAGIRVHSDRGDGDLINFSDNGFTIRLPAYFASGVILLVSLDTDDGQLGETLSDLSLDQIMVEIRWARPAGSDGYIHGCMIKNLSKEQCQAAVTLLRERLHRIHALPTQRAV